MNSVVFSNSTPHYPTKFFPMYSLLMEWKKSTSERSIKNCFDSLDHYILLFKLHAAAIHGNLFRWFASYIDIRTVVLRGYMSQWSEKFSGVPHRSILGPLLFIIFIMVIRKCFRYPKTLPFVDDLNIFRSLAVPMSVICSKFCCS